MSRRDALSLRRHADDDGEHERHGARVADERSDGGSDDHHHKEQPCLVAFGEFHHAAAYHLCQSGLQHGAAHDKQSRHHDDHRAGEARQRLLGRKDADEHQRDERTERDDVRTYLARGEEYCRYGEYY